MTSASRQKRTRVHPPEIVLSDSELADHYFITAVLNKRVPDEKCYSDYKKVAFENRGNPVARLVEQIYFSSTNVPSPNPPVQFMINRDSEYAHRHSCSCVMCTREEMQLEVE